MAINRSEFLRLSSWSIVAMLLPIHQIKALSFITGLEDYDHDNYALAINKAAQAKEHFFKKEYTQAESLYLECIALAPADIRFYDNLQNVYGAQGFWLMCVQLFKNGLIANPNKIAFYDRAARSLMRLELGYPVLAGQYKQEINSNSLLHDAKTLYNQALQIAPDTKYLKIGKRKVKYKIESDAVNINFRTHTIEKEERRQRRRNHKKRYRNLSIEQLEGRLTLIDNKSRNTLYFDNENNTRQKNILKEKKIIYTLLAKRHKNNNSHLQAIDNALQVYSLDQKNTKIVKLIKRLYRKTNNYIGLVDFQRQHDQNRQTIYSALGLMNVLQLKYKKEVQDYSLLTEAINIGEDLISNWGLADSLRVKVTDKLADVYLLNGNIIPAKNLIRDVIETIPSISEGLINNLIHDYAKAYFKNNEYLEAKNILLLGIKNYKESNSTNYNYIKNLASKKTENLFSENLRLYYLLYRVYKKLNEDNNKESVLLHILQQQPENRFALKRL